MASDAYPCRASVCPDRSRVALRLIYKSVMYRIQREFEAVGDTELVEDIVEMVLNGLLGDKKLFSDFLIAETLGHELNDFFFAVAEQRLLAARAGLGRFRKRLHDFGGHAIVEPDFSCVHAMDALDQKIGGGLLQDDPACAKAHGTDNIAIIFGGSKNDDARGQGIEIDFLEDGQSVFVGHPKIEEKNVGLQFGHELDAFRTILSFADDGDFLVGIEELAQAIAEDRMIIG